MMARAKKDYLCLSMKVDAEIMKRFNQYCEEVGQTKTLAFERMVTECIDRYEQEKKMMESLKNGE